jgi:DNA polymerase III epsilon subunit-like protein
VIPPWLVGLEVAMIDTETTGLDPVFERCVEVACVVGVHDGEQGRIVRSWSTVLQPEIPIPEASTAIHGITDAMAFGEPRFVDALPGLISCVGTAVPAAYNAEFDQRILACETVRAYAERPGAAIPAWLGWHARWLDPYVWGRSFQRFEQGKKKLANVAQRLGLVHDGDAHRAEVDAILSLKILWKLAEDPRFPGDSLKGALAATMVRGLEERADLLGFLLRKGVLTK